jgi:hypothetical protein
MAPEWWRRWRVFDWKDDEARERAKRAVIIIVVGVILYSLLVVTAGRAP